MIPSCLTPWVYDPMSRVTSVTQPDPDGAGSQSSPVTSYTYDSVGNLLTVTDPLSQVTTYAYDNLYRLTSVTQPDPDGGGGLSAPVTSYAYDAASRLTSTTDPLSHVTSYGYNHLGWLTSETLPDPDGAGSLSAPVTTYGYDVLGRLTLVTDPLGHDTTFEYDGLSRRTRTLDEQGNETLFAYNAAGSLTTHTDDLGKTTTFAYDHLQRRTSMTNAEGGVTSYSYNAAGQLTSLTDPESNATTWTYNGLGLVASETNALSKTRSFSYDIAGNLTSRTDRRGLVREFAYDGLGRATSETWKTGGTTVRTLDYAYDAASQLLSAEDPDSGYDFTYDHLGRIINIDNDATPNLPRVQLESVYDAASRRTSVTATIGTTDDFVNEYTYDNLDRLTRVDQIGQTGGNSVAEKRVDLAYNALGQFTSIVRYKDTSGGSGNEVATSTFTYDSLSRLTALDHTHGATNLANYDWSYDTLSRVTQFVSSSDGTSDYTYDDTAQVTTADHDYQSDESYTWDDNGNRVDTGYTVGANNRTSSDGTFNYTYDDEGNRLTKVRISGAAADDKTVEYSWDHRNRLTQVTFKNNAGTVTQAVQYVYDVFDRKIARLRDTTSSFDFADAAIERYVYDGDDVVLEFSDPDGNGSSPLELAHRYLFGPAIDQILAQEDVTKSLSADDRVLWPLTDNLGTVRDLADQTGDVVEHYLYNSAGRLTAIEDGSGNPLSAASTRYLFTGREYDAATDLQYNRARWYDAALMQWLSEDPIGFSAGDANLRRMVGNGFTNWIDPSGLEPIDEAIESLDPRRQVDAGLARIVLEVTREMIGWKPDGPCHDGAYGLELEKRVWQRIADHGGEIGTNRVLTDVVLDADGQVLKIGGGPGPEGSIQIDILYYKGNLEEGDVIETRRVIDVFDIKATDDIDPIQIDKIARVTGRNPKVVQSPGRLVNGEVQLLENFRKLDKAMQSLGLASLVLFFFTSDVCADDVEIVMLELDKAGNDPIDIMLWANGDLRTFLNKVVPEDTANHIIIGIVLDDALERLQRGE